MFYKEKTFFDIYIVRGRVEEELKVEDERGLFKWNWENRFDFFFTYISIYL